MPKFFYIPLIGVYNSGKSTILNNIIGYDLLPVKSGECTKKGVLIIHWDNDTPIIRKAKFVVENNQDKNDICYFQLNNDIIAEGDHNVRKILNGINGKFIEKEEDFFYVINVKIKFFENENFNDDNIKEKICFVDLPGYGTKNRFETKDIYSKFIKSCKLFLMVSRDHFEDKDNIEKINGLMEKTSNYQGISIQTLAKKILFIVNPSKNLDISEQSLLKKKKALINNINGLTENVNKDINITFFNGLFYEYYLKKKYYFSKPENLFKIEKKQYLIDYDKFQKGERNSCPRSFESYLKKNLIENLKNTYDINANKITIEIDKEIDDSINKIIKKDKYSFTEKELNEIKKIISYCKNNIEQCNYISKSNYLNFKFYLFARIMICKYESDNELRKLVENNLDNLNKIFYSEEEDLECGLSPVYIEITNESEEKLKEFEKEIEDKIKDIKLDKYNYNFPEKFEIGIEEIANNLKGLKDKIEDSLKNKQKWRNIQNEFENTFHTSVEKQKTIIIDTLEKCSNSLNTHYEEAFKIINKFKNNPDNNYKYDELKIYISNKLGEKNNYKEAIDNIVNDIVSNSRNVTTWKNSSGLIDFLKTKFSDKAYLNKTIDFIIKNAQEKFTIFRSNISNLINEYLKEILNKITIERINLKNILEEKKKKKELENIESAKKNEEEKKRYEAIKKSMKNKTKNGI